MPKKAPYDVAAALSAVESQDLYFELDHTRSITFRVDLNSLRSRLNCAEGRDLSAVSDRKLAKAFAKVMIGNGATEGFSMFAKAKVKKNIAKIKIRVKKIS